MILIHWQDKSCFLLQEKPLDEALTFDNGHICKRSPTEIVKFYMQSAESSELFRGVVDVDLTVVKPTSSDPSKNTEQTSSHPIMVEMSGRMISSSQATDQNSDKKVLYTLYFLFTRNNMSV